MTSFKRKFRSVIPFGVLLHIYVLLAVLFSPSIARADLVLGQPNTGGRRVLVITTDVAYNTLMTSFGTAGLVNLLQGTGAHVGSGWNFNVEVVTVPATFNNGNSYAGAASAADLASLPLTAENYCIVYDMRFNNRNRISGEVPGEISSDTIVAADVVNYQAYLSSVDSAGRGPGLFILGDNFWCDACAPGPLQMDGFISRMETMHLMWNAVTAGPPLADSSVFKIGALSDTGTPAAGADPYWIQTDYNVLATNYTIEYSGYINAADIGTGKKWADEIGNANHVLGVAWEGTDLAAPYQAGRMAYFGDATVLNIWGGGGNTGFTDYMDNITDFLFRDTCCAVPDTLCGSGPEVEDPGNNPVIACFQAGNDGWGGQDGVVWDNGQDANPSGGGSIRYGFAGAIWSARDMFTRVVTPADLTLFTQVCVTMRNTTSTNITFEIWNQSFGPAITTPATFTITNNGAWQTVCLDLSGTYATSTQFRIRNITATGFVTDAGNNVWLDAIELQHDCGSQPMVVDPLCCTLTTPTYTWTPTYTRTYTRTSTRTHTPTRTPTVTLTPTPTVTFTLTHTLTRTPTVTLTPTPTVTFTLTHTPTESVTLTPTPTYTQTSTVTFTMTETVTVTDTSTYTYTLTPTPTTTVTFTLTFTPTVTDTITPGPTPTETVTFTWTPTYTYTATETSTYTLTATPTITVTDTPTYTVTFTRTVTPTVTITSPFTSTSTPTHTSTFTHSPTFTVTNTETFTFTRTATPTVTFSFTDTPTFTATRTVTPTFTPTVTWTDTPTLTATRTATLTVTQTATWTHTPTLTHTPTMTITATQTRTFSPSPTFTETSIPLPYKVQIAAYNEAGELVKLLYSGSAQLLPGQLLVSDSALATGQNQADIFFPGILEGNLSKLGWDGTNDAGQFVDGGMYYIKAEILDQFGKVTAMIDAVQVVQAHPQNRIDIYNAAGERVRSVNLTGPWADITDIWLEGEAFSPVYNPQTGSVDPNSRVAIHTVDQHGFGSILAWDGLNQLGVPVDSGVYTVQLIRNTATGDTEVVTRTLNVIRNASRLTDPKPVIATNPAGRKATGGSEIATVIYSPVAGISAHCTIYNLAGELIKSAADSAGAGRVEINIGNVSSGIYMLVFEQRQGNAFIFREVLKMAIVQ